MSTSHQHWNHGYYTENSYTCGFYRELAPNWLDFAALVKGVQPPRRHEGEAFSYLELGSGMGLGLALMAALYPEGDFLGIDFHPDHIAHSQALVRRFGLTNLRFLEGDFLQLAVDPAPIGMVQGQPGSWTYVVAHGIASWITEPVQEALLAVASRALAPGGIFYCSYNTFPGWLAATTFRQLSELERQRHDPSRPLDPYRQTANTLRQLMGTQQEPSALARYHPALAELLSRVPGMGASYLCQEYAAQGWQPLYVAEMHQRCHGHRLKPVGSATLPEQFDELLARDLQPAVLGETNPLIRETLLDLATNKSFRRDLFCRGRNNLTLAEREQLLGALRVRLQEAPPLETYHFPSCFGTVTADASAYKRLEAELEQGPRSLSELSQRCEHTIHELTGMVALLLHAGRMGLDRGKAAQEAEPSCAQVSTQLLNAILEGRPYETLPAVAIGSAVTFNLVEALLQQGLEQGLEDDFLHGCVHMGLQQLGRHLNGPDGSPLSNEADLQASIAASALALKDQRLPALRRLGLFGGVG